MNEGEQIRDHSAQAREIRVKAAQRELIDAQRKHASTLTTLIILILIVASVQTLALMHVASRMNVVVLPRMSSPEAKPRTQSLLFRGGSADCGNPGKTPAAAGDFIKGGCRERGSL